MDILIVVYVDMKMKKKRKKRGKSKNIERIFRKSRNHNIHQPNS